MPARLDSAVRATAAGVGVCGAATTALPWWTATAPVLLVPGVPAQPADSWRGAEIIGLTGTVVLGLLAVAAVVAVVRGPVRIARPLIAATGAALAAAGIAVLVGWGPTAAPGTWLAAVAGVVTLAGAVGRPLLPVFVAAVVGATPLAVLPVVGRAGETAGAWVRLAPFAAGPPRAGAAAVPDGPARLVSVAGTTAVATDSAIVGLDGHGHARVVARPDVPGEILGVAGDRVVRRIAADRLRVTSLRADDPVDLEIYAVAAAGPVGLDGSLWMRADGDPPGAVRVFAPETYKGPQRLAATFLPVLSVSFPPGTVPVDPATAVPLRTGGVRLVGGQRLEQILPTPAAATVEVLAGGSDPACGLTRSARDAYLAGATAAPAPAPDGGIWLAAADRLLRVDPDGTLRAAHDPLPGPVTALLATPDGAVDALVAGAGLWRLPAAATTLVELPPTPACTPHPPRIGPPVTFVPVGTTGPERAGTPLAVTGRWASQVRTEVAAVTGAERIALGQRDDQRPAPVVPDGSGGVWWLEQGSPGHRIAVHARPGATAERFAEVPAPDGAVLVTDLGGRAPLLASSEGLVPAVPGAAVPPLPGPVAGGVVRADGRGWFLADGRLVATDGPAVLATLVDAGDRRGDPAPAAVQLARGVAPARLALMGARIALDATGRPVVVCPDGVVLRADPATGAVTAIAQDPLLVAPVTVEGGIVQNTDSTLQRVDLPG